MSLWGYPKLAPNVYFFFNNFFFNSQGCLGIISDVYLEKFFQDIEIISIVSSNGLLKIGRLRADKRIGPHNKDIISILYGSLLGDGHAEKRSKGNGTRFSFYQESSHVTYLIWLHNLIAELGYCSSTVPIIQTRLGSKGIVRKIIRFRTWTYTSLN